MIFCGGANELIVACNFLHHMAVEIGEGLFAANFGCHLMKILLCCVLVYLFRVIL